MLAKRKRSGRVAPAVDLESTDDDSSKGAPRCGSRQDRRQLMAMMAATELQHAPVSPASSVGEGQRLALTPPASGSIGSDSGSGRSSGSGSAVATSPALEGAAGASEIRASNPGTPSAGLSPKTPNPPISPAGGPEALAVCPAAIHVRGDEQLPTATEQVVPGPPKCSVGDNQSKAQKPAAAPGSNSSSGSAAASDKPPAKGAAGSCRPAPYGSHRESN